MMVSLAALWLPILLSAVAVFIASSVIHMVLGWHNRDLSKLPQEDQIVDAVRGAGVGAGEYLFPCADDPAENMRSAEIREKWARGPAGKLTVFPSGPPRIGKQLGQWFAYCVVISLFAGYLAAATLDAGTAFAGVFQVAGTAAFLGYAGAVWQDVTWMGANPAAALRSIADGLIYALVSAAVFGSLWP